MVVLSVRKLAARGRAWLVAGLLALFAATAVPAAEATPEHRVKAAFVFKFGEYVEWPQTAFAGPDGPLVIGVLGADPIADELVRFSAGRRLGGRPVVVRKLETGAARADLHVMFIGRAAEPDRRKELDALHGPILTITEVDDVAPGRGAINFVLVAGKVRFDVRLPVAEDAGLRISSRLLGVARRVETGK